MSSNEARIQQLKDKIKSWENRAKMAEQAGQPELTKAALDKSKSSNKS